MVKLLNGVKQILQSYSNLKRDYLSKSPYEKCLYVIKFHTFLISIFGCDFMVSTYKPSLKTLIPAYLLSNYLGLLIYTIYYYRNDPFRALQATPASGLYIPSLIIVILIVTPKTRKQYRYLYNFACNFLYVNSKSSRSKYPVYDRMAIYLVTSTFEVLLLIAISFGCISGAPTYKNLFTDEKEMIIPVILPFIDPETERGFYINIISQLICLAFGSLAIPSIEVITCILKNTVSLSTVIIEDSLTELKNCLERDGNFTNERAWQFRNIILKILDFHRFVINLTDLYYWKFFLQPLFLMYAVAVSLYLYLIDGWITGIGCALCCYTQLIILCDIGKAVEDANDVIVDALNQFPFYLLPPKKQEMYGLILGCAQNGAKVHIGPLAQLNYETATQLTKTIYTYVMLMLKSY